MVLEDVLQPGLKLVLCGTQAGRVSAERRAYYAGPGNKFWRTLHATGLTPERIEPVAYARLLDYGIGLTDVAKLTSGSDAAIRRHHADVEDFWRRVRAVQPLMVAFNGKKAASIALEIPGPRLRYGSAGDREGIALMVLPSTSGAAAGFWDIDPWHELASVVAANS